MSAEGGNGRPDPDLDPALAAENDRRALRNLVLWLGVMALLGAAFLVFSIWIDWS